MEPAVEGAVVSGADLVAHLVRLTEHAQKALGLFRGSVTHSQGRASLASLPPFYGTRLAASQLVEDGGQEGGCLPYRRLTVDGRVP